MTTIQIDRAAFEAHMDATAPAYWRTTEHGRDAWRIWQAALQSQQAAAEPGCDYCNNPLFAGTKCKNCGRVKESLTDQYPNAPWLSEAHALCSDMCVPQGHISDRIKSLREKLGAAEPVKQFRKVGCADWYDGHPDETGGGPYEVRKLYTTPPATQSACTWSQDPDFDMGDTYSSSCGEKWSFIDGGPSENRVKFCHGCGKPVNVVPTPPEAA